ncbi:MAG: insulinase family protein [Acidobacteriota bacterium]|nr:insulinase family protein [Acidobacteriota bacterium]
MKFIFSAFLLLSFIFVNFAQTSVSPDKLITEFDVNGLKVIVKRRPSSPTVSAGLFTRGGVKNQTAKNAGIETLTLATATEASAKYPREVLRKEFARTGSAISGGSSYDFGVVSLTSTRQNFDKTWEIFTDIVLNPAFTTEDFTLTKERLLTGLRNQSVSPDSALDNLQDKVIYANHPYAIDPSGTIESVGSLKIEDLRAYHKSLLQTSRLLLVIVGDLDPQTVQKQITASFGKLPRGDYKDAPTPRIGFAQPTLDVTTKTIPTNYVKGIFAAPSLNDPDYYAMRVAMTILQSRVYDEVRTKRNLSYAPSAEMGNNAANTANIYVTANDANQSVSLMLREIESMKNDLMANEGFTGVPGYFLTTYYINQETNGAQVAELARYELIGGGWRNSLTFLDKIREVTAKDVQAVSQKYMKNLRFVVVGDPAAVRKEIFLQN